MKKYIAISACLLLLPVLVFARSYSTTDGILVQNSTNSTLLNMNSTGTYPLSNSTLYGFSKFSTTAEATNGTLNSVAVTPLGVNATLRFATASSFGSLNATNLVDNASAAHVGLSKRASAGNYTDKFSDVNPFSLFNTSTADVVQFTRAANAGSGNQTVALNYSFVPYVFDIKAFVGGFVVACHGVEFSLANRRYVFGNTGAGWTALNSYNRSLYLPYNSTHYYLGEVTGQTEGSFTFQWEASNDMSAVPGSTMTVNVIARVR